jgi:hypothetical protein
VLYHKRPDALDPVDLRSLFPNEYGSVGPAGLSAVAEVKEAGLHFHETGPSAV